MTTGWRVFSLRKSLTATRRVVTRLCAAGAILCLPAWLAAAPFTLDEVLAALRVGKPPQQELIRQISTRHVSFVLSPEARKSLVAAGASEQLLEAIRFNPELPRSYMPGSAEQAEPAAAAATAADGWGDAPQTASASSPTAARPTSRPAPQVDVPAPQVDVPAPQVDVPAPQVEVDDSLIIRDEAIVDVSSEPITPHEINDLLVAHGDQASLVATISLRGVSFEYTPDLGRAWRDLGATPDLLAALATARVSLPPIPDDFVLVPVEKAANYDEKATRGSLDLRLHVDDIVEVRLQGDRVIWKTLKGSDGRAEESVWNQPFPMGPVRSLEVEKRRGRGQFVVMQQPSMENDFEMMLRIYDPQGGAASYHLRFIWQH